MAKYYGFTAVDPTKNLKSNQDLKGARVRTTPVEILAAAITTVALNDQVVIARVPSNAKPVNVGQITYGAFGGAAAVNLGLYSDKMTAAEAAAAVNVLWAAQSVVAAGARALMASVAQANLNKRFWQLAGMTKNPGGEMEVIMTFSTAGAAAAALYAEITHITD